jgi:hypothetical protein
MRSIPSLRKGRRAVPRLVTPRCLMFGGMVKRRILLRRPFCLTTSSEPTSSCPVSGPVLQEGVHYRHHARLDL